MPNVVSVPADSAERRRIMVDCQLRTFDVTDFAVLDAFLAIPRERYVAGADLALAYSDGQLAVAAGEARRPLLLPMVLARLIQAAEIKPTDRVLDVGGGTGYSAAVLAQLAGSVVALESQAGFTEAAAGQNIPNLKAVTGPLNAGVPAEGPFDVILLNGAVEDGLGHVCDQLAPGGRLLAVMRAPGQVGLAGKAKRFDKVGTEISARNLFDAAAPVLEGFQRKLEFTF